MKKTSFLMFLLLCMTMIIHNSCSDQMNEWKVLSPSGNLQFTVKLNDEKSLIYTLSALDSGRFNNVIEESPLGIEREDQSFLKGLKLDSEGTTELINDTLALVAGKKKVSESSSNSRILVFENSNGEKVAITVRVFDDGAAFRYSFPGIDTVKRKVLSEATGFHIPEESKAWIHKYDKVTQWSPAYETYYTNGSKAGEPAPSSEGWAFPALFGWDGRWVLLTESAVDPSYSAAHLNQDCSGGLYTIRMPEESETFGLYPSSPEHTLPWEMPWRVIITSGRLSSIVESQIVEVLNPPSEIEDLSWIKPGRASWSWWSDAPSPKSLSAQKRFIDLAAEMGWEYCLVDANWDLMTDGSIEDVVEYARGKGIGILMWYNSGGAHNTVTERPRDIMSDPVRRKAEFQKLAAWGVKGVKVDFFQSDKQEIISQYFEILKDAAENRIMVNFHGCTMQRGWSRTWPNLMSMEAVRGAECYLFDSLFTTLAPSHNATLPFTRNAVGSMDYTPVALTNARFPHLTTTAHELALAVVFESGIIHFADKPEAYRKLAEEARNYLKKVPASWDETVFIDGYPGQYCIIARRSGDTWFVGGINGTDKEMEKEVSTDRMKNPGKMISILADGGTGSEVTVLNQSLSLNQSLKVKMLPYGGFAMIIKADQR